MNNYYWILLAVFALAVFLSRKSPITLLWLGLGAFDFALTSTWWHYNLPYPVTFTFAVDFIVAIIIDHHAKQVWEVMFAWCFFIMALVGLVFMPNEFGYFEPMPQEQRAMMLEVLNYLAMFLAGVSANTELIKEATGNVRSFCLLCHNAYLRSLVGLVCNALHRQRKNPPFTKN